MKVLISRLSYSQIGGAELSARDIARSLEQLGYRPLLLTNLDNPIVTKGVKSHTLAPNPLKISGVFSALAYVPRLISQFLFYYRVVKKFNPDVIHPHSRHDQLLLTAVGKVTKKPTIWRDPGDLVPQLTTGLKNPLHKINRKLQLWSIRNATHIITLNEDERQTIHRLTKLPLRKITAIGSDILFEDYAAKPRLKQNTVTYGVICRLDKHKGVQYAIQAFQELKSPTSKLLIAGDGEYLPDLKLLAEDTPNIKFLGRVDNSSDFYNQIDILIQPSDFEGWGRTVKEAMLHHIPVIGSDVGGIAEQIKDGQNGLLFPVGDISSLVDKMSQLQNPAVMKKIIKGGDETIKQSGDWVTKVKSQYIPLFERFIKNG